MLLVQSDDVTHRHAHLHCPCCNIRPYGVTQCRLIMLIVLLHASDLIIAKHSLLMPGASFFTLLLHFILFYFFFVAFVLKWVRKYCEPPKGAKLADKKVVSVPHRIQSWQVHVAVVVRDLFSSLPCENDQHLILLTTSVHCQSQDCYPERGEL